MQREKKYKTNLANCVIAIDTHQAFVAGIDIKKLLYTPINVHNIESLSYLVHLSIDLQYNLTQS